MTQKSKAPTDAELLIAAEAAQAKQARHTNARAFIDRATRVGRYGHKSLQQVKRYDLVGIALTLGHDPRSDSKTAIIAFIEQELAS